MEKKEQAKKQLLLSEQLYRLLEKYHIKKEDILYKAEPDLDEQLRFVHNYLILTKEVLAFVCYPYQEHGTFRFGGYAGNEMVSDVEKQEPIIRIMELQTVEKLEIVREISGGTLLGIVDGVETRLCQFSNSRMSELERLKRNFGKVKKNEELTEEDIVGKNEVSLLRFL